MSLGNLSPISARTSSSGLPTSPLAAAKPRRSGTVSISQTMTLAVILDLFPSEAESLKTLSQLQRARY